MPYLLIGLVLAGGLWWWTHRIPPTTLLVAPGNIPITPTQGQSFQATLPPGAQFSQSAFGGPGFAPWGGFTVSGSDLTSVTFAYSSGGGAMQIQWTDAQGNAQTTIYQAQTS